MEFDKLSEYADEQALKKQTDFILNLFDMVEKKGLEMAEGLKSSFSLFSSANTGTKQMADEIKNSSLTAANYQKVLAALADEVDHLTDAQKEQLKAINENFKAQEQARAGAKETVNLIKTEIAQNEKLEAGRSQLAKTIAQNRVQLQQQNKELMQAARLKESEIGSNKRLDATIAFLTTRLNKLNQATDDGKKKAELYQKSIGKLFDLRKLNADPKTAQALNIGNYQGSAKIIVDAMNAAKQKVAEVTKEFGPLSSQVQQATTYFTTLQTLTAQPQFLNVAGKIGDTNAELKYFVKQLNQLEDAGLKNSAVYKDVQARLAHLTDQLADTRGEVKALSSDTRGFDLFAGSVSFAADAFQTAAGAAQLFGASEKDTQKVLTTLVAIQSVSNGVKGIANELTKKGTAANLAFAFVQKQVNVVMAEGITTAKGFNAALNLTGIGLAITLIAGLISKLDIFGNSEEEATAAAEKFTKALEDQRTAIDNINESLDFSNKIKTEKLKQQGADEKIIFEEELKTKQQQQRNVAELQFKGMALLDDNKKKAFAVEQKLEGKHWGSIIYSRLTAQKKLLEDQRKALTENYAILATKTIKGEQDIELFKEQQKTKLAEEARKKQDERDKKGQAAAKKKAEDNLKASLDLENRKAEAISAIVNENINEEIKLNERIIENENSTIDEKISAAQKIAKAKTALNSIEYSSAIASEKKIEEGKIVIVEKSAEEKLLAETKYNNAATDIVDQSLKQQQDLRKDDAEKQKKLKEELKNKLLEGEDATAANGSNIIQIKKNQDLLQLDKDFNDGKIKSQKEYEAKKAKIEQDAAKEELKLALKTAERKLDILKAFGVNTLAIEAEIARIKKELGDADVKNTQDNADKKLAIESELQSKKKDLYSAGKDLIVGIVEGQFDRQKNQIEELIKLNEDQKNAEIERITQSTASEQDKAAKIAIINAQAQAKKEQLERRQKELDIKKAEFDRLVAIAQIIANTAIAVSKDLAGNKALIPFDIALGALQIAAVLARPLPRFKDGLFDDYEGWAITGDGGKPEVIKRAAGGIEVTPAKDTLTWINKGDRIEPDANEFFQTLQISALLSASRVANGKIQEENHAQIMADSLGKHLQANSDKIVAAIEGKPALTLKSSRGGMEALWKHGASTIKYINENTNWGT